MVSKDWSIGAVKIRNNDLAAQIKDENSTKWNGKIALITVSEYLRSNSNQSSCKTYFLNNNNYSNCKNTTWMYKNNDSYWVLSAYYDNNVWAHYVPLNGEISADMVYPSTGFGYHSVYPTVYLSPEITLSGSGTISDPYTIQ